MTFINLLWNFLCWVDSRDGDLGFDGEALGGDEEAVHRDGQEGGESHQVPDAGVLPEMIKKIHLVFYNKVRT